MAGRGKYTASCHLPATTKAVQCRSFTSQRHLSIARAVFACIDEVYVAALVSGVLWIVGGLLHLAYPQYPPGALGDFLNYLGTAIFSGAYLGMLGGLVELHARQAGLYGRLGTAGFFLAFAGAALAFVGQATSAIFPKDGTLGWLFSNPGFGFQAGILLMIVGLVLLGVATLRARVLPRWCGFGIIALVVFSILGVYGGFVVFGLIWLALGYALWSQLGTSIEHPRRA